MHRFAPVALATLLAATAPALLRAQAPTRFTVPSATGHFTDPANLAGERVRPRNGRELPIDGGLGPDGKPDNALGLAQMLRKLNTRASLMLIVAHPDDEDGGMLAYYSRGLGARVAVLTLTRGEGGQNQMTGDFEDALGLLRTQELLSADRYMGVDTQMFGTEVDFGFTKTKAEAFQKWNHERVLYDAVRAVRIFRPLVIAAVFSGAVTDGHGQHQVSGQIAQEVFKAAGDPNVFPELTREGILPWQPLNVYARVPFSRVTPQGLYDYATGQTVPAEFTNYVTGQKFTTAPTADVTINEGATDPLLSTCAANPADLPKSFSLLSSREAGSASPSTSDKNCTPLSYVQFARIGLGLQRTQIGGSDRISRAGRVDVGYHLYGSRVCAPNLPNPTPNLCLPGSAESAKADSVSKAPTARSITAEGNALGTPAAHEPSAEGAPYDAALANQPSFFDGIDTSLEGIATMAPDGTPALAAELHEIAQKINEAQRLYDPHNSLASAPPLAEADAALLQLINEVGHSDPTMQVANNLNLRTWSPGQRENILHELRAKQVQVNDALALALGVRLDATAPSQNGNVLTNSDLPVHVTVSTDPKLGLRIFPILARNNQREPINKEIPLQQPGKRSITTVENFAFPLPASGIKDRTIETHPEELQHITRPYFTRHDAEQPVYDLLEPQLRNAPASPPALVVSTGILYKDVEVGFSRIVHSGPQPVQIIPPVSLTLDRNAQALPDGTHSLTIDVHTETEDHPKGELELYASPNWSISSPQRPLHAGTETFFASLPAPLQTSTLKAEAIVSGTTYSEGFRPVGYGTLPRTNFYTPATLRIVPVDLKLPPPNKRRIAYLPGTGDDVPAALASIGLAPTILHVSDLTPATLSKFDTVILGVRTYNAHPDLHGAPTQALLEFARNGGNVVVQYQTPEFTAADAPYPLTTHNERVIDETAPVTLLEPAASGYPDPSGSGLIAGSKEKALVAQGFSPGSSAYALLNLPNKITPADFNNWIEERGHGFLDTWDPHYTALTETHDPGAPAEHIEPQAPQRGGLVTVQLGRGRWTYCAFALYRQLPEAVPGAFRLFVNLLNP